MAAHSTRYASELPRVNSCTVRQECLDYALRIREQHGIWGGLNEAERRSLGAQHN